MYFSPLLWNTIMAAFKPNYISYRCLLFIEVIENIKEDNFPLHVLLRTLGLCISASPPPFEDRKLILNKVWKLISNLDDPENYINCAEVWIKYVVTYFTVIK